MPCLQGQGRRDAGAFGPARCSRLVRVGTLGSLLPSAGGSGGAPSDRWEGPRLRWRSTSSVWTADPKPPGGWCGATLPNVGVAVSGVCELAGGSAAGRVSEGPRGVLADVASTGRRLRSRTIAEPRGGEASVWFACVESGGTSHFGLAKWTAMPWFEGRGGAERTIRDALGWSRKKETGAFGLLARRGKEHDGFDR